MVLLQYDAHVRSYYAHKKELTRWFRYRDDTNNADGRPRVDRDKDDYDPLLEALKQHHGIEDK